MILSSLANVPMQPHTFANRFKDIYDAKRPVALVRAQFAMIGMMYRNQGINACIVRRLKFPKLQFALELWEYANLHALQPHRRLSSDRQVRYLGPLSRVR